MTDIVQNENLRLSGTSLGPGLAAGKAFVYRDILEEELRTYEVKSQEVDTECQRVRKAARQVEEALKESEKRAREHIGDYQADIFSAHSVMLNELVESREIRDEILQQGVNAEAAIHCVFQRWARRMYADESTRFIERGDDVRDLGRRLLRALTGIKRHPLENIPPGSILVARYLLPSDAIFFARHRVGAIITEFGSAGSHCALLIRQMGIPGLCSISKAAKKINSDDLILVDGYREIAIVRPSEKIQRQFEKNIQTSRSRTKEAKQFCHDPAVTESGVNVPVMANVAKRADVQLSLENGADGVGLYRLEGLFMLRKNLPTEQELTEEILHTLAPLHDMPAIVRLLDVGSDKDIPYLEFEDEPAPCLGLRGVRVLLAYPNLLKLQIRALLHVSQEMNIQIMVPMVTVAEDMQAIQKAVKEEAANMGISEVPPLMAMIETPAAALSVPAILKYADAISLGTNDLTQHTMATGRENPLVQHYFRDEHAVVMRLVKLAAEEAGEVPVGICGELAGKPSAVPLLLESGIQFLSVAPPLIPTIKEAVRHPENWRDFSS